MPGTTDRFLGTLVHCFLNGKRVANAKSHSFHVSVDAIETTTKDSAGNKEYLPGELGATIDCEGLMEQDPTVANDLYSQMDLYAAAAAKTIFDWRFTTGNQTDQYWEARGFITKLDFDASNNDVASYSFTIQVTGAITTGAES